MSSFKEIHYDVQKNIYEKELRNIYKQIQFKLFVKKILKKINIKSFYNKSLKEKETMFIYQLIDIDLSNIKNKQEIILDIKQKLCKKLKGYDYIVEILEQNQVYSGLYPFPDKKLLAMIFINPDKTLSIDDLNRITNSVKPIFLKFETVDDLIYFDYFVQTINIKNRKQNKYYFGTVDYDVLTGKMFFDLDNLYKKYKNYFVLKKSNKEYFLNSIKQ